MINFNYEIVEIIKERTGNNLSKISNEIKNLYDEQKGYFN